MTTDLPPFRSLLIFEVVGRCLIMKRASEELAVSPGAVSQQIKILEDALGFRLIYRNATGARLTEFGQAYHDAISVALDGLRHAHAGVLATQPSGNLLISALPLFASRWLAPKMFEWQQLHPDISIHLEGAIAEPPARPGHADFRISYQDKISHLENSVALYNDSLVPVCSPALLRAGPPLEKPVDLLAYRLLTIDWKPLLEPPPTWQDWFNGVGVACGELRDAFVFSLSSLAIEAAVDGRGVALAQHSLIAEDVRAGRLVEPFGHRLKLPSPYFLAWRHSVFDKPGARDFHRWIVGLARAQDRTESLMS